MKLSRNVMGVAAGLGVLLASSTAFAQTTNQTLSKMEYLLPPSIDAIYTLDTTKENPLEGQFLGWIKESMSVENSTEGEIALTETMLQDNQMVFAFDMDDSIEGQTLGDPKTFMAVSVSDTTFDALYAKAKSEMTISEETYKNTTMYVGDNDTVVLHINGLFIMTNSKEDAQKIIDRSQIQNGDSLANSESYQEVMSHENNDAFFSMYVNPTSMSGEMTQIFQEMDDVLPEFTALNKEILGSVTGEGIWVTQVSDGYIMNVAIEGDQEKLQSLDMEFNQNNFTPTLWERFSGKGLMVYGESNISEGKSWSQIKTIYNELFGSAQFTEWKTSFEQDSGINFDNDIMDLMTKPQMVAVHKTEQLFPAFTWMVNVASDRNANYAMTEKFNTYLKAQMLKAEKEDGVDFYDNGIEEVNGQKFYKHTFNFGEVMRATEDSAADIVPDEKVTLNLYFGTTNDGLLVVSTHPDFNGMYSHSMKDNTKFTASFPSLNQTVADIGFIDLKEFTNYLTQTMENMGASASETQSVEDFMAPFGVFSWITKADSNSVWATLNAKVDMSQIDKTIKVIEDWSTQMNSYYDQVVEAIPEIQSKNYCDIKATDWYADSVFDLSKYEIINGYEDGCFHPERNVTRAEFTKMALMAAEKSGYYYEYDSQSNEDRFEDVNYTSDWFAPIVDKAAANGLINGYSDGRFHPNANITRAEAVQVLFNMSSQLKAVQVVGQPLETLTPFNDVTANDWYLTAVAAAYKYELVNGATETTFEPNRFLTRAEAAKIIQGFYALGQPNSSMPMEGM